MENAGTMYQILLCVIPKIPHVFPLPPPPHNVPLSGKIPVFVHDWSKTHATGLFSWGWGGRKKNQLK